MLNCLGPRTWTARTGNPEHLDLATITQFVAWAGELQSDWKLHPSLLAGKIPMWTVARDQIEAASRGEEVDPLRLVEQLGDLADPKIVVYVMLHPDVDLDGFQAMLPLVAPTRVLSKIETNNSLVLRLPFSTVKRVVGLDEVAWLEPALPKFAELNDSNRMVTQVEEVQASPYGLDGTGVTVMVYDGGQADASHPDFSGRLTTHDSSGTSSHATHVSGTVGGDGSASGGTHRGMAPNVNIVSYGFEQEGGLSEGFLYTDPGDLEADYSDAILNRGAVIANNSIGTNTAPNGFPCEWTGDYGVTSNLIDQVVRGALGGDIRIMWANGNERQTTRCGDGFYTTAPPACAKNHITVGALNSNDESVTSFTSWGPSDDGRIKPDLSGPGCQSDGDGGVTSCVPGGGYSSYCGTSMSSPTLCGIGALVIQDWRALYPDKADPMNSTLKALLANSGADLGPAGPDCMYGFGTVRAKNAIDQLRAGSVIESAVADSDMYEFLVIVSPEDEELKITLAWDDEPASPLPLNALVNDLDLVVLSPSGERHYPWTIDPSDPGAEATQDSEDHINNMEQVSVASPTAGAWRVQIRGFAVPVGPQSFSVSTTPEPTQCSSSGIVGLDRAFYPLDSELSVTVVDCDLNTDDTTVQTIEITVTSDDEPSGETIVLVEEDPAASVFSGSLSIVSTDVAGSLLALNGSTVQATYIDAEDADGNTDVLNIATAVMDGDAPTPQSVEVTEYHPDGATISVAASEPVRITIRYGSSCGSLNDEIVQSTYNQNHDVRLSGLVDTFSYAFSIEIEDMAGNAQSYDNNGDCWTFTIPDFLDLFAEQFGSGIDVAGYSVRFDPISTADAYIPCAQPIVELPVNPAGGSSVSLSDDSSQAVTLPTTVTFYNAQYDVLYINSNGSVTFEAGSTTYTESLGVHFDRIGVSGVFDDLNPSDGGTISWKSDGNGVSVTFDQVAEYGTGGSSTNTFQVLFGQDGSVTLAWLELGSADAIIGLSPGTGTDPQFIPTDFNEATEGCVPRPPSAADLVLTTAPGQPLEFLLAGSDDGQPDPPGSLAFTILSLPAWSLYDQNTDERITPGELPYTFANGDEPAVRFQSPGLWEGQDGFTYMVDDGGSPPEGGPSNIAEVSISVISGPSVVYDFPLDSDPGWFRNGDWAFGVPTGGGGQYGNPDPTTGHTGPNVLGYNLNGDYGNNISEYVLETDPFDCSDFTDTSLRFWRWLNVESPSYDHARLQINNGSGWTTIWENEQQVTDSSWNQVEYDISSYADGESSVSIRWTMGTTDSSWQFSGWNIDDIEIIASVPNNSVPGDLNGDGIVNGEDVGLMLAAWGSCPGCPADFNGDGIVDGEDFGLLLSYWTGDGGFAPMHAGPVIEMDDRPEIRGVDLQPEDLRLINMDRLAPREHDGLVIASDGYLQEPGARLEIELTSGLPIEGHDLLLVGGLAELDGHLELHLPDTTALADGLYVVVLADAIAGDFQAVTIKDRTDRAVVTCTTEQAVLVRIGEPESGEDVDPAVPADVLDLLDALGTANRNWDLDANGRVDYTDLAILLAHAACVP
ncbi:MAG: S8 family serine peptidase [Phycisphaerales bacterium]|nr:S8 family serine peptidase [Phycisphaerales bacterium]